MERDAAAIDLSSSNPTRAELPYPASTLAEALGRGALEPYEPDARGLRSARETVARAWLERGAVVDPDHVLLTSSTSEAYALVFKVLGDPGDEVLIPEPSYPLIEHLARFEGLVPRPYRLVYDGRWHLDMAALARSVGPRTRAIAVVSPNNPTGSFVKWSELERLAKLEVPIISDEVFAAFPLDIDRAEQASALGSSAPLVFALDGLSKRAALPQLKLAWVGVSGRPGLVAEAVARLELVADMYLCASSGVQRALPEILHATEPLVRTLRERLAENLRTLHRELAGSAAAVLPVEGGWSAVVQMPNVVHDWAEVLLDEERLGVQPGWFYDLAGAHIVVSLLAPVPRFQAGVARIVRRLGKV